MTQMERARIHLLAFGVEHRHTQTLSHTHTRACILQNHKFWLQSQYWLYYTDRPYTYVLVYILSRYIIVVVYICDWMLLDWVARNWSNCHRARSLKLAIVSHSHKNNKYVTSSFISVAPFHLTCRAACCCKRLFFLARFLDRRASWVRFICLPNRCACIWGYKKYHNIWL